MKKYIKTIFSIVIVLSMLMSAFVFNVSAASMTVGSGNYEVGQNVSVSIAYEGDAALVSVLVTVSYDAKVLKFNGVSGVKTEDINATSGSIRFMDENFSNGSKKGSYRINFTAIAAGSTDVNITATGSDGEGEFPASKVAKVTVTTPKPSSNANLSSIKLSAGAISPAFNSSTTNYTATVKYGVESITITGAVADGKSTCTGNGTFDLNVGNNEFVLNVKAEDGTKKSYFINIKRMTEEETLAAEEEARNSNPTLVVIDGVDYTIVTDLSNITIPTGFTEGTVIRKGTEIPVLLDAGGKYQLCWLVDANGENGAFYNRDENDNFTKLAYINANGVMYIIENIENDVKLPSGFVRKIYEIDGVKVDAVQYTNQAYKEFYIFNCYTSGQTENAFYRYDMVEGTMQRAIEFNANGTPTDSQNVVGSNSSVLDDSQDISWFASMSKTGKLVFLCIVVVGVLFIAIAILLIVKISSSKDDEDDAYISEANSDFVLGDEDETEEIFPFPMQETEPQQFESIGENGVIEENAKAEEIEEVQESETDEE